MIWVKSNCMFDRGVAAENSYTIDVHRLTYELGEVTMSEKSSKSDASASTLQY